MEGIDLESDDSTGGQRAAVLLRSPATSARKRLFDYTAHPDHGSFTRSLAHRARKQLKLLAWIVGLLSTVVLIVTAVSISIIGPSNLPAIAVPLAAQAGLCLGSVWLVVTLTYVDYRAVKRFARTELEMVRGLRRAFQTIERSLQKLHSESTEEQSLAVDEHIESIRRELLSLLSEASRSGTPYLPEFLLKCAVIAAAEGAKTKPDVTDLWIWLDQQETWWCPENLPYLNKKLPLERVQNIERQKDRLRPRTDTTAASMQIMREMSHRVLRAGEDDGALTNCPAPLRFRTCLGIPLIVENRAVGVMWLRYDAVVPLADEEITALRAFCTDVTGPCHVVYARWRDWIRQIQAEVVADVLPSRLAATAQVCN